mgnify:FL=1|jgi:hypothetical protein|tara:strand:- start:6100 stop:7341 length:1242 start_codon:yes stop_codon:yes gene_type:complete
MDTESSLSKSMNKHCLCKTLDRTVLEQQLHRYIDPKTLLERPHLFSDTAYYISEKNFEEMESIISAIENVTSMESFQEKVGISVPPVASTDFGPKGVLMGYDFHLTDEGPKLIEINTNAGGAYLNMVLAKAQVSCCEGIKKIVDLDNLETVFFDMFLEEWTLQRGELPLNTIAVVDDSPQEQYLFPEFLLFAELFQKHQIECVIIDPSELTSDGSFLTAGGKKIDLIYNRSTDFYFEDKRYAGIRNAYLRGLTVVTPGPYHHATFANKLNLTVLSDALALKALQVDDKTISILAIGIPRTIAVTPENRSHLWQQRKNKFFKPVAGYGSKATYRGDKITLKVWDAIAQNDYVAQEIARPGERIVHVGGDQKDLKMDIRVYTYRGRTLLLASRLYQGQTTNFRTQGGGFAPVFLI